jgi:hypothetical protein
LALFLENQFKVFYNIPIETSKIRSFEITEGFYILVSKFKYNRKKKNSSLAAYIASWFAGFNNNE